MTLNILLLVLIEIKDGRARPKELWKLRVGGLCVSVSISHYYFIIKLFYSLPMHISCHATHPLSPFGLFLRLLCIQVATNMPCGANERRVIRPNPPPPQAPKLVAEDLHLSHTSCRHTLGISPFVCFFFMYIHTRQGY